MESIFVSGVGSARPSEVGEIDSHERDTIFRHQSLMSACRAVEAAGFDPHFVLPRELNPGGAFFTVTGERYPAMWADQHVAGRRTRASQFGAIIHSSGAGHIAIKLGLVGPQVVLVAGNVLEAAVMQMQMGRSKLMVVTCFELNDVARSIVLETQGDPPFRLFPETSIDVVRLYGISDPMSDMQRFELQYDRAYRMLAESRS